MQRVCKNFCQEIFITWMVKFMKMVQRRIIMIYICWILPYTYIVIIVLYLFSEGELEEVLTTYTKINKSASIFLGGHPKNSVTDSNGQTRPTSTFQHSRPPSAGPNRPPNATSGRPPISRQSSLLQNRPGSGSVGRSVNMSASDSNMGKKKEGEGTIEVTPKTITGWEDPPKFGKAFLVGF